MGSLKAAIALLPDRELSNRVSAAALVAHAETAGRLRWPRLTPHLSLKQPFAFESLPLVDGYFQRLARELTPIDVSFDRVEVRPPTPHAPEAVVWVGVRESEPLRLLHERLNRELSLLVADASAPFDGAEYRFHITLGFLPAPNLSIAERLSQLAGSGATFRELGLFVYDGLPRAGWQCLLYERVVLGAAAPSPSS